MPVLLEFMKKTSALLFLIAAISIGVWLRVSFFSNITTPGVQPAPPTESVKEEKDNVLSFTKEPEILVVAEPISVNIPKIEVHASVESVGMDNQGRMDVPKNEWNVAWYNLGVKPGEKGNAVMAGHLDSQIGPAVFYNLTNLQAGDLIIVTDKNNRTYTYRVTTEAIYRFDQFPLQEVFGATDKSRLNLITCGGIFNGVTRNYSNRVVVYSELIE